MTMNSFIVWKNTDDFIALKGMNGEKTMEHKMKLQAKPMELIKSGEKTIELRLYDEKRRKISAGDTICFENVENRDDILKAEVLALYVFESFEELYRELPLTDCGYGAENAASADPQDMELYYSKAEQANCGVVGIKIKLI